MDINAEIDKILREKGVVPPHMTDEQFATELIKRIDRELPWAIQKLANRISKDIFAEEMSRLGRSVVCRHAADKSRKHCNKPANCATCLNYKPLPRRRRWPMDIAYIVCLVLLIGSFISMILSPQLSRPALVFWFVVVFFNVLTGYVLYKRTRKYLDDLKRDWYD